MIDQPASSLRAPLPILLVAFVAAASALAGGYWDDDWHTERGRDTFFIAPHIAIYAGIAGAGAALSLWALLAARAQGLTAVWRHRPLALALVSVGATLASGPIDNAWHEAFGRDSVIWSPPHMLGIAGTLSLAAALLAELASRPERWTRPLATVAGALVLAAAGFATVEYDTDVPQFSEVFYLPVLGLAASIALVLVRVSGVRPWAATEAAALYTLFVVAIAGFLLLLDFAPPALPLLIGPAIAVDLAARRRWHPAVTAAAFTVALHLLYVPVRNLLGDGVRFDTADVLLGAPLTWLACFVVFSVAADERAPRTGRPRHAARTAAAAVMIVLASVSAASAHDPGQGEDAGTVALTVEVRDSEAVVSAEIPRAACAATEPVAIVARRAGETQRGSLRKSGCRLRGTVALPRRGRWFVYAVMRRGGRTIESWVPVSTGRGDERVSERGRYAYTPRATSAGTVKTVGGLVLYGAMLALLYATFRLVRAGPPRGAV